MGLAGFVKTLSAPFFTDGLMEEKNREKKPHRLTKTELRSGRPASTPENVEPGDGLNGVEDVLFDVSNEPDLEEPLP
jgi:hypothetical protein